MKKTIFCVLLCLSLFLCSCDELTSFLPGESEDAVSASNVSDQAKKFEDKINSLESDIEQLQDKIDRLEADIEQLNNKTTITSESNKTYEVVTLNLNNYKQYLGFNVTYSDHGTYTHKYGTASVTTKICNMHIKTIPMQPGLTFKGVSLRYNIDPTDVFKNPSKYLYQKWTTSDTALFNISTQVSYNGYSDTNILIRNGSETVEAYPNTDSEFVSLAYITGYVYIEK